MFLKSQNKGQKSLFLGDRVVVVESTSSRLVAVFTIEILRDKSSCLCPHVSFKGQLNIKSTYRVFRKYCSIRTFSLLYLLWQTIHSWVTVYALICTSVQFLPSKQDSFSSLMDTLKKTIKTNAYNRIGRYFSNTLYIPIIIYKLNMQANTGPSL